MSKIVKASADYLINMRGETQFRIKLKSRLQMEKYYEIEALDNTTGLIMKVGLVRLSENQVRSFLLGSECQLI